MPILQGNTKTISKTTFRTPPDTTAIMESFGAPSFLTKVCKKVENAKKPSPQITYGDVYKRQGYVSQEGDDGHFDYAQFGDCTDGRPCD